MIRRETLKAGLAVLLAPLAGCQIRSTKVVAPFALTRPVWRLGERWGYQVLNGFNSAVESKPIFRVAKVGEAIDVEADDGSIERYNAQLQLLAEPCFAEPVLYNSPVDWFPAEGKSLSTLSSTRYLGNSTPAHRWQQTVTVQGYESVTVPAGTFNCALIQRTINFEHPDRFRSASERVDRLWFAPEVRRWVQRDVRGSYLDSGDIDDKRGSGRRSEHWRIWQLTHYTSPPIAG
jgi:hypothetical protein